MTAIVAADAGGTQVRLVYATGATRISVRGGPANATTDFAGAVRELAQGIDLLSEKSGVDAAILRACPAYLGVAGVQDPVTAQRLASALALSDAVIAEDRIIAVQGALGAANGTLAHCGTGSFLARRNGQSVRTVGGWGPVLGDEASAVWIGKRALRAALAVHDKLADPCALTTRITADAGGSAEIVALARDAAPIDLGRWARAVTETVHESAAARGILSEGALLLATTIRALGWTEGERLCLTGGLGAHYAPFLPPEMAAAVVAPEGEPIDGAVALALQHAGGA